MTRAWRPCSRPGRASRARRPWRWSPRPGFSGAVVWRRSRTSSSPSSRSTRRVYAGSTVWDRNACRGPASTDVALHEQRSCSSHATTSEPARLRSPGETSSRHRPRRTATSGHASARSSTRPRRANPRRSPTASTTVGPRASPRSGACGCRSSSPSCSSQWAHRAVAAYRPRRPLRPHADRVRGACPKDDQLHGCGRVSRAERSIITSFTSTAPRGDRPPRHSSRTTGSALEQPHRWRPGCQRPHWRQGHAQSGVARVAA